MALLAGPAAAEGPVAAGNLIRRNRSRPPHSVTIKIKARAHALALILFQIPMEEDVIKIRGIDSRLLECQEDLTQVERLMVENVEQALFNGSGYRSSPSAGA